LVGVLATNADCLAMAASGVVAKLTADGARRLIMALTCGVPAIFEAQVIGDLALTGN
jgi:hypothetical protein